MSELFPTGVFRGEGRWVDQKTEGRYTAQYTIHEGAGGVRGHRVERDFLKADGTVAYEERTSVTFEPKDRDGVWVSIDGAQGIVAGPGYALDGFLHYDINVTADNHLEFTFHVDGDRIYGSGSATNKGNRTYWVEALRRS